MMDCEHDWGKPYHTHLGHPTLGSHSEHRDCLTCGAIKNRVFGSQTETIYPHPDGQRAKAHWTILDKPHTCSAGWRGEIVEQGYFDGLCNGL